MAENQGLNRGRKFNMGRQDEQFLNEEWHSLFMALKYLNYERYMGKDTVQERQTEIPERALRFTSDKKDGIDKLQSYYSNNGGEWKNLFEGYYHPINTLKPPTGKPVSPYQLCIDSKTGAIMYWENGQWMVARANEYTGALDSFNGMNFQFISPLEQAKKYIPIGDGNYAVELLGYYPVPYVPYGKLFSKENFVSINQDEIIEEGEAINTNNCAITPSVTTDISLLSWVHVNASKLVKVDRRLIEIDRSDNRDRGFIAITSTQSEFYLFKTGQRGGKLLIKGKSFYNEDGTINESIDYIDTIGGITLADKILNDPDCKYIYSLTYSFDESPSTEGKSIVKSGKVTGENEVYIGAQISDSISVFMDGLSLERTDEENYNIYEHDRAEGVIRFTDDDDAEIINQMQMTTLLFPNRTEDFTLSRTGSNITATTEDSITIKADGVSNYKTPFVFCSGLGLQETEIFEDIIVNKETDEITIKGLVLLEDENGGTLTKIDKITGKPYEVPEVIKGYVADVGDSFVCEGILDKPYIEHDSIEANKEYAVFVNGILLTPTNQDIKVDNGRIDINNAEDVEFDNLTYIVFCIDDADENKIALVFDESVSYFSIRIDDGGLDATYNDCNCALLYLETGDQNTSGLLLDQAAVEKPINPVEGYYKHGQILKVPDFYGNYTYYKYDYNNSEPVLLSLEQAEEVESIIGYYATTGSIHLVGNNKEFSKCDYTYFAYSYANMIDEVTTTGCKRDLPINVLYVKDKYEDYFLTDNELFETYTGSAGKLEGWKINCASLSTYINGLLMESKEIDPVEGVTRHYSIKHPTLKIIQDTDYYGKRNLWYGLEQLYNRYIEKIEEYKNDPKIKDKTMDKIKFQILNFEPICDWKIDDSDTVKNYFYSELMCKEALELAIYIKEDMQREHTSYAIERIERDEFVAAHRDWIHLDANRIGTHQQIYRAAQDTVETDFYLVPGTVNIYLNGQLLSYDDYCKFSNNKVMFNMDVCGLQQLPSVDKMMTYLPDRFSVEEKLEYQTLYNKKQVIRLIEDKMYYIPTDTRDTILIEKRDDTSIKSVTYDVLISSYTSYEFSKDYYDMPDSLMNTTDFVKIYINGIYYDEGYVFTNNGGIKGIKLLGKGALTIDPVYEFLQRNPEEADKYLRENGTKYKRTIDKITFEWR